jgi:hypothetical protein
MTAHPVPPVIPGASRGHLRQGKSGAGRPMPLASPPGRPDVVYGFGRIGASGRDGALRRRHGHPLITASFHAPRMQFVGHFREASFGFT